MKIKGIGIDVPDARVDGDMSKLQRELEFFAECGFDTVELTVPGLYLILNGRLDQRRAEKTTAILEQFPFTYTLHLPDNLNLARAEDPSFAYSIASECLDFASAAHAEVAVYHCGLDFLEANDEQRIEAGRKQEIELLRRLASMAQSLDIVVAIENSDPRRGEGDRAAALGISGLEVRSRHPALDPIAVAAEVNEIAHPNVGMTLDFGHFFLASALTGQEYLSTVDAVSVRVDHLHLNDNFGKLGSEGLTKMEEAVQGLSDCHLPPGMGSIPLRESLGYLSDFSGYIILELRAAYHLHFPDAVRWVRGLTNI